MAETPRGTFYRVTQRELRARARLMAETRERVVGMLRQAAADIRTTLAAQPSDYQRWYLPQLLHEVNARLAELADGAGATVSRAAGEAWSAGERIVDAPLRAVGIDPGPIAPAVNTRQLLAMREFMVERIRDVSEEAKRRIGAELGQVVIGTQTPSDAIGKVTAILGEGSRVRATTIVRTEIGRVHAVAAQARLGQVAERVPGLKKRWMKSGKLHPRPHHDAAHGQVRAVDEPFHLLGPKGIVKLMFPHDPAAPAAETINCGCVSVPHKESWGDLPTLPAYGQTAGVQVRSQAGRATPERPRPVPRTSELEVPKVRRVLSTEERQMHGGNRERAIVVDQAGNVLLRKVGSSTRVPFTPQELGLMKGAIVSHTHTAGIGSFSVADAALAAAHELAELRAVDAVFTYSLRPPATGWSRQWLETTMLPRFYEIQKATAIEFDAALAAQQITGEQYDVNFMDEVWRRTARALGIRYRRRRHS